MLGEFELAAETLETTLSKAPDRTSTNVNLGAIYNRLGRHDDAIDRLNQAVKADWRCVEAYYNLGVAYSKKKNHTDAKMMFQEAARLRPEMVDAWLQLGTVFLETSNPQLAASSFRKVLSRKPDHEKARRGLRTAESQLKKAGDKARVAQLVATAPPPVNCRTTLSLQDQSTIQSSSQEIEQTIDQLLEWFRTKSDLLLHRLRKQISNGIRRNQETTDFCKSFASELKVQSEQAAKLDAAIGRLRDYHERYVQER